MLQNWNQFFIPSIFVIDTGDLSSNDGGYWNADYTTKSAHTAYLPEYTSSVHTYHSSYFDENVGLGGAFLFYKGGTYHYAACGAGPRFECDDYPGDDDETTNHNIYVSFENPDNVFATFLYVE